MPKGRICSLRMTLLGNITLFWHGDTGLASPFHVQLKIYGTLEKSASKGCLRLAHLSSQRRD